MKNPLLTHGLYAEFIAATCMPNTFLVFFLITLAEEEEKRLQAIKVILGLLPHQNRQLLQTVCVYLNEVKQYKRVPLSNALGLKKEFY